MMEAGIDIERLVKIIYRLKIFGAKSLEKSGIRYIATIKSIDKYGD